MSIEVWVEAPGYEGVYYVSNISRVKKVCNNGKVIIRKPRVNHNGYLDINLSLHGKKKKFSLHRLVWEAFNGPIPEGMLVNHINEDKTDNRLENLNLMSLQENIRYGTGIARRSKTLMNNPLKSKPVNQYNLEGELIKQYPSIMEACRSTGISFKNIQSVCSGYPHRITAGGYLWTYA